MLNRFFRSRSREPNASAQVLRQASDIAVADLRLDANNVHGSPASALSVVPGAIAQKDDASTSTLITDMIQLPDWRDLVGDVVRKSDNPSCVVLEMQMRSALILATPDYYASGSLQSLRQNLAAQGWQVQDELTCSASVIAEVRLARESRKQSNAVNSQKYNQQLYKDLNSGAYTLRASDMHIRLNLREDQSVIRLRIDGKMRLWKNFDTKVLLDAVAAAYHGLTVKGTNSAPSWSVDRQINTITEFSFGDITLRGRLSTQPTTAGCKVVIRISNASADVLANPKLQDLGMTDQQVNEDVMPALGRAKGFIMISGSTGDGKTTTLQHMLMALPDRDEKALLGVEDPSELEVPDMDHISLQRSPDDTREQMRMKFDAALLQGLRLDPDVIMQGEIRDQVSGAFASDAVGTGHLWMGTLHGNSALGGIFRLIGAKIGIEPEILANEENFVMSMAQKLVPKLCEHCKKPAAEVMAPSDLSLFRNKFQLGSSELYCANPDGCEHCQPSPDIPGDGEKGRIAAIEIIANPTSEFLNCVLNRDQRGAEIAWRSTRRAAFNKPDMRGKTSYEHAVYWVSQGVVSPVALQKVFGKHYSEVAVFDLATPVKEVA